MELTHEEIENIITQELDAAEKIYGAGVKDIIIKILSLEKMLAPTSALKFEKEKILIPLSEWNKYHADPSVPALRMLDFKRAENGFDEFKVTERRGKRVLINEENYFKWYDKYHH